MTAKLGDIFWSENSFTHEELRTLLTCESHKLFSFFFKLDQNKKNELLHFLILHDYADKTNLISIFKENTNSSLPIDSSLKLIPLLIEEGELSLADDLLKKTYEKIFQKNLINKIQQISEIREKYFLLSIDFIFSEVIFYLENMMNDAALKCIDKIEALLSTAWRRVKKSKTKNEYQNIIFELYNYYKDNDYRFYKRHLFLKEEYSKKEKTQLLLFGAYEPNLLELVYEKMSIEQQELISTRLGFKKTKKIIPIKKEKESTSDEKSLYKLDKKLKRINERDRLNLIDEYIEASEEDNDESYILSLIRIGHFDENDNISDLIYGFYNIGYYKAVNELVNKYNDPLNKLVLSELYLSERKFLEAKILAMEVIEVHKENPEILEWAKKVLSYNE